MRKWRPRNSRRLFINCSVYYLQNRVGHFSKNKKKNKKNELRNGPYLIGGIHKRRIHVMGRGRVGQKCTICRQGGGEDLRIVYIHKSLVPDIKCWP